MFHIFKTYLDSFFSCKLFPFFLSQDTTFVGLGVIPNLLASLLRPKTRRNGVREMGQEGVGY